MIFGVIKRFYKPMPYSLLCGGIGLPDESIVVTACVFACARRRKMMKIMSLK
jgi:hypothetical protein